MQGIWLCNHRIEWFSMYVKETKARYGVLAHHTILHIHFYLFFHVYI